MSFIREHVFKRFSASRSSDWPKVRKMHLKAHPTCAVCGKGRWVEVHHNKSFYLFPYLELDFNNLTTFCRKHHLQIGHVGYWRMYNSCVEETVRCYKALLK